MFCFKDIPFSKVKSLRLLSSLPFHVQYKTSFDTDFVESCIQRKTRSSVKYDQLPIPTLLNYTSAISLEKKKDIQIHVEVYARGG